MKENLNRLMRRVRFQRALKDIYETPSGKIFFEVFMDHCGVTNPKFSQDPVKANWNESRRHLAMSYLRLLGLDDMEALLAHQEKSLRLAKEEEIRIDG